MYWAADFKLCNVFLNTRCTFRAEVLTTTFYPLRSQWWTGSSCHELTSDNLVTVVLEEKWRHCRVDAAFLPLPLLASLAGRVPPPRARMWVTPLSRFGLGRRAHSAAPADCQTPLPQRPRELTPPPGPRRCCLLSQSNTEGPAFWPRKGGWRMLVPLGGTVEAARE